MKSQIFSLSLDFLEKCGNVFSINEKNSLIFPQTICAKLNIENKGYVMPKKVLPSESDFEKFGGDMEKYGFRMIEKPEFFRSFQRLGLSNPRKRPGREIGFTFSANGLTAIAWTTFLGTERCARDEDAGWVLISEGDRVKYFSHPLFRTAGFLNKLLKYAIIAKRRVLHRPLCPACNGFMQIVRGKGLKSRYWKCPKHRQVKDFDNGLTGKMKDFLESERKARRHYRENLKKQGRETTPAILTRRPWITSKPKNRI